MDNQNYVAPAPGGGFTVVVGGQNRGTYPDQAQAEQAFNSATGQGTPTPGATPGGFNWPGLGNALGSMNQQDFDEMIRQFNAQLDIEGRKLGLDQQRIDEMKREFDKTLYSNMAMGLVNGAVDLAKTPANWLDYANYTNMGKDIFQSLNGSQATPAFGAPSGVTENNSISQLLAQLGITPGSAPGAGAGASAGQTDQQALDFIWAKRPDLAAFYQGNGWDVSTPEQQRAAVQDWITKADPSWAGMNAQQVAGKLGYTAPAAVGQTGWYQQVQDAANQTKASGQPWDRNAYINTMSGLGIGADAAGGIYDRAAPFYAANNRYPGETEVNSWLKEAQPAAAAPATPQGTAMVPLPYQINPAVWDSMSGTAKQMILASAQQGNTPSGYWHPDDFMSQLNAARPKGQAPRSVNYNWGQQQGSYF